MHTQKQLHTNYYSRCLMFRIDQAQWARLRTSSLCAAPWKCDNACIVELNSRLHTSHRGFSRLTEHLVVSLVAADVATRVAVTVCESVINWPRWLDVEFCSNDWNTANKSIIQLISLSLCLYFLMSDFERHLSCRLFNSAFNTVYAILHL